MGKKSMEGFPMRWWLIRIALMLITLLLASCRGDIGNLFDIY